jgi:hypothetical protein
MMITIFSDHILSALGTYTFLAGHPRLMRYLCIAMQANAKPRKIFTIFLICLMRLIGEGPDFIRFAI